MFSIPAALCQYLKKIKTKHPLSLLLSIKCCPYYIKYVSLNDIFLSECLLSVSHFHHHVQMNETVSLAAEF